MRKPTTCIGENKDARQIEQFLFFKLLAFFCDCTGQFVSDLVGNPNCWFSHVKAHFHLTLPFSDAWPSFLAGNPFMWSKKDLGFEMSNFELVRETSPLFSDKSIQSDK